MKKTEVQEGLQNKYHFAIHFRIKMMLASDTKQSWWMTTIKEGPKETNLANEENMADELK